MRHYGPADSRARTYHWPAKGRASVDGDQDWHSTSLSLWPDADLQPSSSRTYQGFLHRMPAGILGRLPVRWGNSGYGGRIGFWTRNGSECRSDEEGCSSSPSMIADLLLTLTHDRFLVSSRAARGIIERSDRRGRRIGRFARSALTSLADGDPGPPVRRITPTEAERMMGWPDGWTISSLWPMRLPRRRRGVDLRMAGDSMEEGRIESRP